MVDYGIGFEPATGRIRFRAEHNNHWAVDGQAGVILRTYREHQMSADDQFLRRVWPQTKKALEFMISHDTQADGIIDGPQHNTLDADWWGQVAWLSGLYLAALRAGEEMARERGDAAFAQQCRAIFERGRKAIDQQLFNGEYYVQIGDPAHAKTVGSYDGCEIDQVFGDSWAWQVGLGRILDETHVKTALQSLWRYNFTPDVGPYRAAYKPGRWYALAGEGGLLMCSWPRGEQQRVKESFDFYFNECMTGFEYQVAWHMVAAGLLQEGLAITRAIHDRYHAARRNPWNEVECGDHYARAMASYGVFLAVCGYEYHGPQGRLGFAPRLKPEDFRAAFTTAEGWGTFAQRADGREQQAELAVKWGQLRLQTLTLAVTKGFQPAQAKVAVDGKPVTATLAVKDGRAEISLAVAVVIKEGEKLTVALA
jgi:non-lysosomal glucosylceramidase